MKYFDLNNRAIQLENDIAATFVTNVERILKFAPKDSDFGLPNTVAFMAESEDENITHIGRGFKLFVDNYVYSDESRYVNFSDLSQSEQLEVIAELEKIQTVEDIEF